MSKLVSVVIPCYNSAPFLAETLRSVAGQDHPSIETILVDDGSTDTSVNIAEEFLGTMNLTIIKQPNSGVSAARNRGFMHASGKYVIFLDSDDVLLPSFISSKVRLIENGESNCAGSEIYNFTDAGKPLPEKCSAVSVCSDIRRNLLSYEPAFSSVPSSFLFCSELFEKSESTPFNLRLMSTADRYLLIEYADRLNIVADKSPNAGLLYRIRRDSMSNVYNKKLVDDNALFYDELVKNRLIESPELGKGYVMLLKSYLKINDVRSALKYLPLLLRARITSNSKAS